MKIGINALYLLPGKVGGSETYIRNLVKHLDLLGGDNTYFIFINKESIGVFPETSRIKTVLCPIHAASRPIRILWEQCILPFQIKKYNIDAVLSAGMTAPFFCPARSILTILDLQHINQPQNFSRFHLFFLRSIIYLSAKTADGIMTISEHVKQDIVKFYKIRPEKIAVGYLAVQHNIFTPAAGKDDLAIRAKYGLPERYILYAAALLPHKNHERLLTAFKAVKDKIPGKKLVFTGAWNQGYDKVANTISALDLKKDVIMLGWLPFEEISAVFRGAELFVYPTLHEGFGLPILEAMASGVPVVCSKIEPLIEVSGDASMFVDPLDPADIANGILSVLTQNHLREHLVEKGAKRARQFTWEATAQTTLVFLNRA
ncbi:glycosyltransferase family 4 protein [Desulfosudis oleivorans]|uniref:Glycosyl transferase group 1 n=1 Tax=Desulfosudis oleivorans (strain DSM 6200 / JCM 39069 / Hxd3) TaxID=96561 RepID=A8ZT90_DESOH|nr:glycosyltransferase family 1 protein [Desulfosudis oleivorans]ABW67773.1 glycosyl transferase group 1 [Desulfosudis oleivorans Hxd3]